MFDIEKFNEYREDNRLEVKKAKDGLPISLWDTYSSFANCYGGVIILGVKENKDGSFKTTGLENKSKLLKEFWDLINNKNKVSINLLTERNVEIYEENGNVIMVIHVPKANREQKPVYINNDIFGGTFRRDWEGDYRCSREEVLGMLRDQPEETADMKVLENVSIEDLDYREMLEPTIRWTDRLQSSSGDWKGNLFEFYFRVYNKMIKDIKIPFRIEGGDRIDDTPIHKALREALANCLVNTDYYGVRGVVIKKEVDSIIIENPGSIRTGKQQMLKGGISDPRNKALMKMFNMINIGERAGSGVPDIFMIWKNEGWMAPIVEEEYNPDRTILILTFAKINDKKPAIKNGDKKPAIKNGDKKPVKKTKEQYEKILKFMVEKQEYKLQDFCKMLGLKESRTREILKDLVKLGNLKLLEIIKIENTNYHSKYTKKRRLNL